MQKLRIAAFSSFICLTAFVGASRPFRQLVWKRRADELSAATETAKEKIGDTGEFITVSPKPSDPTMSLVTVAVSTFFILGIAIDDGLYFVERRRFITCCPSTI